MIRATKGKSMDGWMDGWMDGQVDRWIDQKTDQIGLDWIRLD